jgi:hypothetical protein
MIVWHDVVCMCADFSVLTLAFPLSMFLYSMISVKPAKAYWQVALVYCEALIIAQYAYQVPTRLGCAFISPDTQQL